MNAPAWFQVHQIAHRRNITITEALMPVAGMVPGDRQH